LILEHPKGSGRGWGGPSTNDAPGIRCQSQGNNQAVLKITRRSPNRQKDEGKGHLAKLDERLI
jgi:hypothetical protein